MTSARFSALRSRDFRLLFIGQAISITGTQMQHVAVAWQLYLLTKSPLSLGMIGLFRVLPVLVLALGGGVVADALDRRRLMLAAQLCLALSSATLAFLSITDQATPAAIYAVLLLSGAAIAFEIPARQALLPLLVPREDLPNALSLNAMVWQLATIAGPSLAGLILGKWGVVPVYVIDVVSFLAVITSLLLIRSPKTPRGAGAISLAAAFEGLRFLKKERLIFTTMLLDFIATFFGASMQLMPIFADQLLDVGPEGLGLLYAAQPAGAALAAAALSLRPIASNHGAILLVSVGLYGAAITVFGASPWLPLSLVALAVSGAADTVGMVIRQTLRQLLTPDELRGRMTSVNMIFFMGGPQLGEMEAGIVAALIGTRLSVATGGVLSVLATIAVALAVPALRTYVHPPEPKAAPSAAG
ncbi:MFS transporter [Myxococcota bacterium]|nr:MFS transporter [Myxococcota bacterium]